jgi:hypothetical protein
MARRVFRKTKRRNRSLKIASATGAYDNKDYRDDQLTLKGLAGAAMTPKLEQQINRILKRMERRSWD